jgi:nucleotide-binding universal stress UspA family protein
MKVIVPIDNKPSSQALIDALMGMRWNVGTEIKLLTVVPRIERGEAVDSSSVEEIERLAIDLQGTLPMCEVSLFVREGDPKTEIIALAEEFGADLILMGSNCKGTLERLLLGSVSQSVLNEAECPVLIARPECDAVRDSQHGMKTVLIPIDDSIYSEVALRWLVNFQWPPQTRFVLATVVEAIPGYFADSSPAEAAAMVDEHRTVLEHAQQTLNTRAKQLSELLNTNNVFIEIGAGNAIESIIKLGSDYYADLIVMGSHGRTGIKKLILGSVSQAVSQNAPCSIAIVRGIAEQDDSWTKTGVFKKPKAAKQKAVKTYRRDDDYPMPHVFPAGMG